ncbi:glutathione hydrolase 1 proenzyme [Leptinotarsa decemlineata]|uniref:glutathione hydrolase 1 proenzyme n=1 Tax=Leptinotarsa decemlineata TaxID=7539 RepID=UPI003D304AEC
MAPSFAIVIIFMVILRPARQLNRGSVVTNGYGCSEIGGSIIQKGGNAVDAAIAALFCEGVSMPECMGLGGGFLLTLYNKSTQEVWTLNAREAAPGKASWNMYIKEPDSSKWGGKAVAVPGELRGYWHLYQKFGGGVPWKELVQPTIDICKRGVYVTKFLEGVYKKKKDYLYNDSVLRDIYINPETNDTYKEGQFVKLVKLAKTLEVIAEEGGDALNNGSLTVKFVQDIQDNGGIITIEDMQNYQPQWQKPVTVALKNNETLFTSPLPGSGIIVAHILNILTDFINDSDTTSITTNQRIVEAFKFAYGKRGKWVIPILLMFKRLVYELIENYTSTKYAEEMKKLISDVKTYEDPQHYGAKFTYPEDHGTAHISVLTPEGDAVSVTSTINLLFGAGFASNSTGIILNNEMRDFSSPNMTNGNGFASSPANFVAPGKRSMSAMCPSVVLDHNKEVLLVIGGAGGPKITTSVAVVIMRHLWFGMDLKHAIDEKRLHHQLFPMEIIYDTAYQTSGMDIVQGLASIGHNYSFKDDNGFAAITAISRSSESGEVVGCSDMRRPGYTTYLG